MSMEKASLRISLSKATAGMSARLRRYFKGLYTSAQPYHLARGDKLLALAISLLFLFIYALTVSHHVNVAGDSPEILGTGYSLGIMHPPGYPTYTMLCYIVSHAPVGSIAFRLNFFSSILHVLTLYVLFVVLIKITRHRAASAVTTAVIGISPLFWFYSLVAEVFPLNDLFAVLLVLVALMAREAWLENRSKACRRLIFLLLFLCGLSLTHHQTIVLVFPALLFLAAPAFLDSLGNIRRAAAGVALFISGLLPYAYIPLRAAQKPYANFGDPSSLSSFLAFISRRYYGSSRLWIGPQASHRVDMVFDYLKTLDKQIYMLGILLVLLGMYAMARKRRADFLAFFTVFLLAGVVFPLIANVALSNPFYVSTIERFYLMPTIMLSPFAAFGLAETIEFLKDAAKRMRARKIIQGTLAVSLVLLLCLPFYLPIKRTYEKVNLRNDLIGEGYLEDLIRPIADNSVLFLSGDVPIQLVDYYYQSCVKEKKDITTIIWSFWGQPWYMQHLRKWYPELNLPSEETPVDLQVENASYYRIWLLEHVIENNPQISAYYCIDNKILLSDDYRFVPGGLVYRILPSSESVDDDTLFQSLVDFFGELDPGIYDYSAYGENRRELMLVQYVSTIINQCASYFRDRGQLEKAITFNAMAYTLYPFQEYEFQTAEMYAQIGNWAEASALFEDYVEKGSYLDSKTWEALIKREEINLEEGLRR
ncbi:MAG: DUF2723 domain-containing protein [Actinobacteria bacterium]|nr:DUF2723 domain-containing protein [Actinomycetota bacterium]